MGQQGSSGVFESLEGGAAEVGLFGDVNVLGGLDLAVQDHRDLYPALAAAAVEA